MLSMTMTKRAPAKQRLGNAPALAELQADFQQAILSADDKILSLIPGNGRTTNDVLFGVYKNAYIGRLIDVIACEHEHLQAYLGGDDFRVMAKSFIAANPSKTQNARWFADPLPDFLAATEPYASQPELTELARLERTLAAAFDAPDADAVQLSTLQAIDPQKWERLIFLAHPSVTVLSMTTNALAIWLALKGGAPPPAAETYDRPQPVLIWRQDVTPMVRVIPPEEHMMWQETVAGATFGNLCEVLAVFDDPDTAPLRAAQNLAGWLASGMLAAVTLSKPKRRRKL